MIRRLEISYGHAISSQKLSVQESLGGVAKCRRFHGHNANIEILLSAESSDINLEKELQMVTDANNLKGLEAEINKYFDHRTYVSNFAQELHSILHYFEVEGAVEVISKEEYCPFLSDEVGFIVIKDIEKFNSICKTICVDPEIQKNYFDSFVIIKGETTIENLSRILHKFVQEYLDQKLNKDLDTKFIDSKGNKLNYKIKCNKIIWSETSKSLAEYEG